MNIYISFYEAYLKEKFITIGPKYIFFKDWQTQQTHALEFKKASDLIKKICAEAHYETKDFDILIHDREEHTLPQIHQLTRGKLYNVLFRLLKPKRESLSAIELRKRNILEAFVMANSTKAKFYLQN